MAGKSTYLQNKILEHVLKNTTYTAPATVYLCLLTSTAVVGDTGALTGKEIANSNNYSRKSISMAAASNGSISNTADVVFDVATGNWSGTIAYFAITDNPTWNTGNMLYFGQLSAGKTINSGDQIKFLAGNVTVTES